MKFTSVYIHIPFCRRKCNYCDFVSYPVEEQQRYFSVYGDLLLKELKLWQCQGGDFSALESIYFGGGTPSLLAVETIAAVLSCLPQAAEITLEANPETVDLTYLQQLRKTGVNRLSLGAQSFNDQALRSMGRCHTVEQTKAAFGAARQAGFTNINIDLIYGWPNQDKSLLQTDLQAALALGPQHISLYGLSLSEQSPWGQKKLAGQLAIADSDLSADLQEMAMETLESAGLWQYEIANYALKGFASRHNCAYWRRQNYLGIGCAAASCYMNQRWSNLRNLGDYTVTVEQDQLPVCERETLSIDEVIAEAIFLGLRLRQGIDLDQFAGQYGLRVEIRFAKQIRQLVNDGLLVVEDGSMRLSKKGILLGNEVFYKFI